jgi:hypothetical protein
MSPLYPILSARCGVLRDVRATLLTAAFLLACAAPAQAQTTVTMDPLKPCYFSDGDLPTQRETIHVRASGFTPQAPVTLSIDGVPQFKGESDAFGTVTANVPAPFQGQGERTFTLTLSEDLNGDHFVTVQPLVSNLGVTMKPRKARPSKRIRFTGRGFTAAAPVFGHYLFGGKVRKTVRFAKASTLPCGTFKAKRKQIPVKRPHTGEWLLQVDQQRKYAPIPLTNAQRVLIKVTETFKQPSSLRSQR